MSIKNIIVSSFAVAIFGTVALAQGGQPNPQQRQPMPGGGMGDGKGPGMMMGRGMRGPGMRGSRGIDFSRLNLTDAQKQRVQALMDSSQKSREATRGQFEEMGKLMRLKREGLLTTEQGTRLTSLEAQMKTNAEKMHNDLLAILTPEQKTLVDQMKNQRGGRGGMMRDRQPMRRGGQPGPGQGPGRPIGGGGSQPPQAPPTDN